eukprot:scaffold66729_cov33-Tisochrysis_lutea.AAC.7
MQALKQEQSRPTKILLQYGASTKRLWISSRWVDQAMRCQTAGKTARKRTKHNIKAHAHILQWSVSVGRQTEDRGSDFTF